MPTNNLPPSVSNSNLVMGFAFPFQPGPTGFPSMAQVDQLVYYHIVSVLMTGKNEKIMNASYGVSLYEYVFENLTPLGMARVVNAVKKALALYVPEIRVLTVRAQIDKNDGGEATTISVLVEYRVNNQTYSQQVQLPLTGIQGSQGTI